MKNLLIIYPHWHPANLAGVHRPRLVGNYLKEFGWKPRVITVKDRYFEERPDSDFVKTFSEDFEVTRVDAFKVTKPRVIGDIGLRAFWQLYKGSLEIIRKEKIDFIWIPIPSFYCALLGRLIHAKTNIPYGIDYIDPWVRDISNRRDWRHRISNSMAKFLEPIAVKKASLITGVSFEYYKPVIDRNFKPNITHARITPSSFTITHAAFPYGFDPNDHRIKLKSIKYPWPDKGEKPWIYAGAFLPNSKIFLENLFSSIAKLRSERDWDDRIALYFVGTGAYPGISIIEYATEAGISDIVHEDRSRHPFLHVLNFLSAADTVMVLGSTEKHYTASKVYQALLSGRPVWSIFHEESSAVAVEEMCKANQFLVKYRDGMELEDLRTDIKSKLTARMNSDKWRPDLQRLNQFSARESARKLVEAIEKVVEN